MEGKEKKEKPKKEKKEKKIAPTRADLKKMHKKKILANILTALDNPPLRYPKRKRVNDVLTLNKWHF